MTVRPATVSDLDWMVSVLSERRGSLVDFARVVWRPAPDASERHREFLEHLLREGSATAYRTDTSLLVAPRRGDGWLIDDLHVSEGHWENDGRDMWNALASESSGDAVRFVCPTYEANRRSFAHRVGLDLAESWWLMELETSGGEPGAKVALPGGEGITVAAPPVYGPPGPMLFIPALSDPRAAVYASPQSARQHGCAGVVVNQTARDTQLAEILSQSGFRRHCDYFTGILATI